MRVFLILFIGGMLATAQTRGRVFDVASVKPVPIEKAQPRSALPTGENGRYFSVATLYVVINWAFDLNSFELQDLFYRLPPWARRNSYEIEARTEGAATEAQCLEMVQALLAERFKFAARWDVTEGPVFHLVVARGGSKMQRVTDADQALGVSITRNGRPEQPASGATNLRGRTAVVRGFAMNEFAEWLSERLEEPAPVLDKTGLEGLYKINLRFSGPTPTKQPDLTDPDLRSALLQQLGLRLDEAKGPVRRLVFDQIEPPDAN